MLLSKFIIVSINSSSSSLQKYKFLEIIVFLEKKNPTNKQKKEEATGGEKNLSIFNDRTSCAIIPCLRLKFIDRIVRYLTRAFPWTTLLSPWSASTVNLLSLSSPLSNADDISSMAEESERTSDIFRHLLYHRPLPPPTKIFLAWFWMRHRSRGRGWFGSFCSWPVSAFNRAAFVTSHQ